MPEGARGGGRLSNADVRQLASEAGQRRREGEQLARDLRAMGMDREAVDEMLQRLRALETQGAYADAEQARRMQQAALDQVRALEFALRRSLAGSQEGRPVLGRAADAPASYRALVAEYYRSLAQTARP